MNMTNDAGSQTLQDEAPYTRWQANQIAITFSSPLSPTVGKKTIIRTLALKQFAQKLREKNYLIRSFTSRDVPARSTHDIDRDMDRDDDEATDSEGASGNLPGGRNLNSTVGKYLFGSPDGRGSQIICFFHLIPPTAPGHRPIDATSTVVNLLNGTPRVFDGPDSTFSSAMPNWLNGATPNSIHGCPITPPQPATDTCPGGNWHIALPTTLPEAYQIATGQGVTVLILDTVPSQEQVQEAAGDTAAQANNPLLESIANTVTFPPESERLNLPEDIDGPNPPVFTGKDVYGDVVGFTMTDHGLFVAGIIRDVAPDATIECIRVLNDRGVGDTTTLTSTLETIQSRLQSGDLTTPLVINMSLVASPTPDELGIYGLPNEVDALPLARQGLRDAMQSLASNFGVVFVCSAGNDTDPRDQQMNMMRKQFFQSSLTTAQMNDTTTIRQGPRFPAAFAYMDQSVDGIIPVGAVNQSALPASYSNYPGYLGVATYGGELPTVNPATQAQLASNQLPTVTINDALHGIYSSLQYPAAYDPDYAVAGHVYQEDTMPGANLPNAGTDTGWVYWSGTSFATPIISALAARILQAQPNALPTDVRTEVLAVAGSSTVSWDEIPNQNAPVSSALIMATQQCLTLQ